MQAITALEEMSVQLQVSDDNNGADNGIRSNASFDGNDHNNGIRSNASLNANDNDGEITGTARAEVIAEAMPSVHDMKTQTDKSVNRKTRSLKQLLRKGVALFRPSH